MARSYNQKASLLYLHDYLLENTNKDKIVTNKNITDYLKSEYDITIDRKTVYTDIGMLQDYGLNVEYDYKQKGYKVKKRKFSLDELQLIVDSVQSSKFITKNKAKELTDKLKDLTNKYDRSTLENRNYVANRIRSENDEIFKQLNTIHECIKNDTKICFRYFDYDINKKRVYQELKSADVRVVSPFALVWDNDNYYLIAYFRGIKNYRVDKMENVIGLKEKSVGHDKFKELNLSENPTKIFSMYKGTKTSIVLRCRNELAGVIIDTFGREIRMISTADKQHFTVMVSVEVSPQFYGWLCGLGKSVKIISPLDVVEKMEKYVADIIEMYKTDTKT